MAYVPRSDREYLAWIEENRSGYVVNVRAESQYRRSTTRQKPYAVLHRATCPLINSQAHYRDGAFVERLYRKFCSLEIGELKRHVVKEYGHGFSKRCQICGA